MTDTWRLTGSSVASTPSTARSLSAHFHSPFSPLTQHSNSFQSPYQSHYHQQHRHNHHDSISGEDRDFLQRIEVALEVIEHEYSTREDSSLSFEAGGGTSAGSRSARTLNATHSQSAAAPPARILPPVFYSFVSSRLALDVLKACQGYLEEFLEGEGVEAAERDRRLLEQAERRRKRKEEAAKKERQARENNVTTASIYGNTTARSLESSTPASSPRSRRLNKSSTGSHTTACSSSSASASSARHDRLLHLLQRFGDAWGRVLLHRAEQNQQEQLALVGAGGRGAAHSLKQKLRGGPTATQTQSHFLNDAFDAFFFESFYTLIEYVMEIHFRNTMERRFRTEAEANAREKTIQEAAMNAAAAVEEEEEGGETVASAAASTNGLKTNSPSDVSRSNASSPDRSAPARADSAAATTTAAIASVDTSKDALSKSNSSSGNSNSTSSSSAASGASIAHAVDTSWRRLQHELQRLLRSRNFHSSMRARAVHGDGGLPVSSRATVRGGGIIHQPLGGTNPFALHASGSNGNTTHFPSSALYSNAHRSGLGQALGRGRHALASSSASGSYRDPETFRAHGRMKWPPVASGGVAASGMSGRSSGELHGDDVIDPLLLDDERDQLHLERSDEESESEEFFESNCVFNRRRAHRTVIGCLDLRSPLLTTMLPNQRGMYASRSLFRPNVPSSSASKSDSSSTPSSSASFNESANVSYALGADSLVQSFKRVASRWRPSESELYRSRRKQEIRRRAAEWRRKNRREQLEGEKQNHNNDEKEEEVETSRSEVTHVETLKDAPILSPRPPPSYPPHPRRQHLPSFARYLLHKPVSDEEDKEPMTMPPPTASSTATAHRPAAVAAGTQLTIPRLSLPLNDSHSFSHPASSASTSTSRPSQRSPTTRTRTSSHASTARSSASERGRGRDSQPLSIEQRLQMSKPLIKVTRNGRIKLAE